VRYVRTVDLYDAGSYREAEDAFAELLSSFSRAREQFENAAGVSGALDPYLTDYVCDCTNARIACVEYRAACRAQLDGETGEAERRRAEGDRRYTACVFQGE
jgi:hypothetical protein